MKQLFDFRIERVLEHLAAGDSELGYRKMLDLVRDTQDMQLFHKAIELTQWRSANPRSTASFVAKCVDLTTSLHDAEVAISPPISNIVTAKEVTKRYNRGRFMLGPVSLTIDQGKVYGLVGENGNGKTTLLRILGNELAHTSGQVSYQLGPETENLYNQRSQLVFIPQRTATWYGSLKNNLRFVLSSYGTSPEEIDPRVDLMIARLGLWEYRKLKWSELSSGYKMRFELARTLLQEPKIMLLDEPLANLDVLAQQVVLEDLKSIAESLSRPIAMILSSQQLYGVEKISDEVIYLKEGKYTSNNSSSPEDKLLIIELESGCTKDELIAALATLEVVQLSFNGGVYVASFAAGTQLKDVLIAIANNDLEITYLRDISSSTRRFFVQ